MHYQDFNGFEGLTRFLWINDIESHDPEVVCLRFTRVIFDVLSSPFLLNATLKHHVEKYSSFYPEIVRTPMQPIYMDDVVAGVDGEDEAYTMCTASLSHASFHLRKLATNSLCRTESIQKRSSPRMAQLCRLT